MESIPTKVTRFVKQKSDCHLREFRLLDFPTLECSAAQSFGRCKKRIIKWRWSNRLAKSLRPDPGDSLCAFGDWCFFLKLILTDSDHEEAFFWLLKGWNGIHPRFQHGDVYCGICWWHWVERRCWESQQLWWNLWNLQLDHERWQEIYGIGGDLLQTL